MVAKLEAMCYLHETFEMRLQLTDGVDANPDHRLIYFDRDWPFPEFRGI